MAKCTAYIVDDSGRFYCGRHLGHTSEHQTTVAKESIMWVAEGDRTQLVGLTPVKERRK